MSKNKNNDKPSIFYWVEVTLLVLFFFGAIYIYSITIELLGGGKINPIAITSMAIAAIGMPGALLTIFYNHNTKRYECRNKRTVELSKNGNGDNQK